MARAAWLLGAAVLSLLPAGRAFYLPGAAPHDYHEGEKVDLFVNTLTPMIAGYDNAKLVRTAVRTRRNRSLKPERNEEIAHQLYSAQDCHRCRCSLNQVRFR